MEFIHSFDRFRFHNSHPSNQDPSMATTTPPTEIITDILLRLPIKGLLRSKSVSKSWYSLISSPEFIKLHHQHHPSPPSLVLAGPTSLQILHSPSLTPLYTLPFPSQASLVGALHGLVCVFSNKTFHYTLLNPLTRQSQVICKAIRYPLAVGFGYDEGDHDYWIIQILYSIRPVYGHEYGFGDVDDEIKREVRVYSTRKGAWRVVVSEEVLDEEVAGRGCVVDGRMHWVSAKPGNGKIVSFDVAGERFGEVTVPLYYEGKVHRPRDVAEMGGKLCFLTEANRGEMFGSVYIDVWRMSEYGDEDSWSKLYGVWCSGTRLPYPIASDGDGDGDGDRVLYCEDGKLCWFDRDEQKIDRPELSGVDTFSEAVVCVGSLPFSFKERSFCGENSEI